MALTLKKQTDASVRTPSNSKRVQCYFDGNEVLKFKDSTGAVASTLSLDESPITLKDQTTAPATVSTRSTLYAKDVSGNSEIFVVDGSGTEVQLTNAGSLNTVAGGTSAWFPSGSDFTHTINYTGASGESRIDTGLQVPLIADQVTSLMFRFHVIFDDGSSYLGWRQEQFYWQGGLPSLPDSIFSFSFDFDDSPGFTALPYSAVDIGSDGIVEVAINSASSIAGLVKITAHTFVPTFTIGG